MFLQFVVEVDRSENVSMNGNYPSEPNIAIEHRNAKKKWEPFPQKEVLFICRLIRYCGDVFITKMPKTKDRNGFN